MDSVQSNMKFGSHYWPRRLRSSRHGTRRYASIYVNCNNVNDFLWVCVWSFEVKKISYS